MTKAERNAVRQQGGTPRRGRKHHEPGAYNTNEMYTIRVSGIVLRSLLKYKTSEADTWLDMVNRMLIDLGSREEAVESKVSSLFADVAYRYK